MQENSALGRAMEMVRDLRSRCPWDRAQTRETLRPYLVEEVLEVDQALVSGDPALLRDEMGDFLLHLAWQLVLAEELGEFTAAEVADDLVAKMQRRHPHLFDLGPARPWEQLKRRERPRGTLEGLPPTLPPLLRAFRLQERAASVGFDWDDVQGPMDKVREELREVEEHLPVAGQRGGGAAGPYTEHQPPAIASDELIDEIGDLLFAVVNLSRKAGVAPGNALDRANRKFTDRFRAVERLAAERGIDLHSAGLVGLDRLWDEVKEREEGERDLGLGGA
ncbi:MAG TPA: nucleoside triphosphate pyrophosphohydrolase [Gemmatimonadales bacterium]|jgi:nucleoside triphosphate diphosphatase|nr:nucleoside triphosphate pyrophosphohydrolase [Gemmatimonadales bacterium]